MMGTFKPITLKPCLYCGKVMEPKQYPSCREAPSLYKNRRYCNTTCRDAHRRILNPPSGSSWYTCHFHARRLCPPAPCADCGATGRTEVHHKNEDWHDNRLENLERLCRSCHLKRHRSSS